MSFSFGTVQITTTTIFNHLLNWGNFAVPEEMGKHGLTTPTATPVPDFNKET